MPVSTVQAPPCPRREASKSSHIDSSRRVTVLADLWRKITVFSALFLLFYYPGLRLAYAADLGQFYNYSCFSGPTNSPITLQTTIMTVGNGVNNKGDVVGYIQQTVGHYQGYVFTQGTCYLFDYPGASATFPEGIRDDGLIYGYYTDNQGNNLPTLATLY